MYFYQILHDEEITIKQRSSEREEARLEIGRLVESQDGGKGKIRADVPDWIKYYIYTRNLTMREYETIDGNIIGDYS
jgi:hypothetical protein